MKKTFEQIAFYKKLDIAFQCIAFAVALVAVFFSPISIFGLYIMGLAQALSSVVWLIADKVYSVQQRPYGKVLRVSIIVIICLSVLLLLINSIAFLWLSCFLLLGGPVLGISYFVTTIKEQEFYARSRKPYYLL